MKKQHIFKMILFWGITLFSTGISSQIPCFIDGLLLYVAYLCSGFSNSKMVTECEPKLISMDFGFPRTVRGVHVWKAQYRIGLARRKRQFQQQYPTYFCCNKDLIRAMLPIYYGTSSLTFCQISGLKEAFENIIKHQTALKFEFQEHASYWPEDFCHPTYAYFSCNRDLCRALLPIYLGTSSSTICQV